MPGSASLTMTAIAGTDHFGIWSSSVRGDLHLITAMAAAKFSGTPAANSSGIYTVVLTAQNGNFAECNRRLSRLSVNSTAAF